MKKIILTSFIILLIISSCMGDTRSYKERNRKENIPERLFKNKELYVAKAIYDGDTKQLEKLIVKDNINPNSIGLEGHTFLQYAIMMEDLPSMEVLLRLGADPNKPSKKIFPITAAASRLNIKMLKILFEYKANPNPELGMLPLEEAIMGEGGEKTVDYLMRNRVDVNHINYSNGNTIAITALQIGKIDYIYYFLSKGLDPLKVNFNGASLAYLLQEKIKDDRINNNRKDELQKIIKYLEEKYTIHFPLEKKEKEGLERRIKFYENLTPSSKKILGKEREEMYEKDLQKLKSMTN